jgi:hypothetical protein
MPIEPIDPYKKVGGNGNEKYNPQKEKFGPSEYDKAAEKVKQDNEKAKAEASKMAEEHRAKVKAESPRTYAERLQDMGRMTTGGGGAMPKSNRDITKNYKAGGKVSSASKRADGIVVKGKTKGRMI